MNFFAFYIIREVYPHMISNPQTHFFALSYPYKVCHNIFVNITEKLEPVAHMQVFSRQLYWWLPPEEEEVSTCIVLQLEKDNCSCLFALWTDVIPAVMSKDLMRRTAMGGLKTGSFIRRYNIPGAKLSVNFARIL